MLKTKILFASVLSVGLVSCQTTQVGAPSSDFDGVYSWKKPVAMVKAEVSLRSGMAVSSSSRMDMFQITDEEAGATM